MNLHLLQLHRILQYHCNCHFLQRSSAQTEDGDVFDTTSKLYKLNSLSSCFSNTVNIVGLEEFHFERTFNLKEFSDSFDYGFRPA